MDWFNSPPLLKDLLYFTVSLCLGSAGGVNIDENNIARKLVVESMLLCADREGAEILSDEGRARSHTRMPYFWGVWGVCSFYGQLVQAMTFSTLDEWSVFFFFFLRPYANCALDSL